MEDATVGGVDRGAIDGLRAIQEVLEAAGFVRARQKSARADRITRPCRYACVYLAGR